MEEHKKMEEKKKIEEEEKAKKILESAEKAKEEADKVYEKKTEVININAIDGKAIKIENQPAVFAKENEKNKIKDTNANKKAKDNLINNSNKNEIELNNYNSSINPTSIKYNNHTNINQEVLKPLENLPTERKIKEKMELNNLLKNLNYVEEDIVNEQTDINFEIPYHLTKEWVVKNLLS